MPKAMKHDHGKEPKERGRLAALRESMPALPPWMERIDELVGERWSAFWPVLRLGEELAFKVPPVDVYEDGRDLVLKAELPGLRREDIKVEITGDLVTLSGKKEKEERIERKDYHRVERAAGAFTRTVRLPVEIAVDRVTAKFTEGVLEIRAPMAGEGKGHGRKIEVT